MLSLPEESKTDNWHQEPMTDKTFSLPERSEADIANNWHQKPMTSEVSSLKVRIESDLVSNGNQTLMTDNEDDYYNTPMAGISTGQPDWQRSASLNIAMGHGSVLSDLIQTDSTSIEPDWRRNYLRNFPALVSHYPSGNRPLNWPARHPLDITDEEMRQINETLLALENKLAHLENIEGKLQRGLAAECLQNTSSQDVFEGRP
jgi:hypothetical protein